MNTRCTHPLWEYLDRIQMELGDPEEPCRFTKEEFLHAVVDAVRDIDATFCVLCGVNTSCVGGIAEYYMVHDDIWRKYGCFNGMLCIGCLEDRMGRQLVAADFTDCPVNTDEDDIRSARLVDRLSS